MNNFFRKILIKITGIGWCGTPWIQMEKAEEEAKKLADLNSKADNKEINVKEN